MEASYAGFAFGNGSSDLYNGNIRHLVTAIEGMDILGTAYRYDQLQRLTQMTAYYNTNAANTWSGMSATTDYYSRFVYDMNGNMDTLQRNATSTIGLYMDNLAFHHVGLDGLPNATSTSRSNRLNYVTDSGANDNVAGDVTNTQTTNNYVYDEIGALITDVDEGIDTIYWRKGDKRVRKIVRDDQNSPELEFFYNPFGQRVVKLVKPRISGVLSSKEEWTYTYYGHDANGQVIAIYDATMHNDSSLADVEEFNIYGASRLGQIQPRKRIYTNGSEPNTAPNVWQNTLGLRAYEITDHRSSVKAAINDRKLWNATDTLYEAVILMATDLYSYGWQMPGRNTNFGDYRYGMQGSEQDPEMKGNGNSYTTEFRQYDPRIPIWWSLDPLMAKFPWMSPYVTFDNNPIYYIDPLGLASEGEKDKDKGKDKGNGKQREDGTYDGDLEVQAVKVTAKRTTGEIIPPRPIQKKGNYSMIISINGTSIKEINGLSRGDAMLMKENKEQKWIEQSLAQSRNRSIMNMHWETGPNTKWRDDFNRAFGTTLLVGMGAPLAAEFAAFEAAPIIAPYLTTSSLISCSINAGINLFAQWKVNGGNWSKIDRLSTTTSFASGFLPGSTPFHIIRNSMIAGGVDALFDNTGSNGFSSIIIGNKNLSLTISDFGFNSLGNMGALSFGKNPFLYETIGTGISIFPTTVVNKVVNDKIGN